VTRQPLLCLWNILSWTTQLPNFKPTEELASGWSHTQIPDIHFMEAWQKIRALENCKSLNLTFSPWLPWDYACVTSNGNKKSEYSWVYLAIKQVLNNFKTLFSLKNKRWQVIPFWSTRHHFLFLIWMRPVIFFDLLKTNHMARNFAIFQSHIILLCLRKEIIGPGNEIGFW